MKIAVLNGERINYDGACDYSILGDDVTVYEAAVPADYPRYAEGADIIVTKEIPVNRESVMTLPKSVKLIAEAGTGYNNIDLEACKERGIAVINVPAYSSERVAHTAAMLMLNLASTMQIQLRMLAQGDRSNFSKHLMVPHVELNNKTIGIIGAGNIGMKMLRIAQALDMNILVYNRSKKDLPEGVRQVELDELLASSDVVSLHCPLNDATRHLINADTLKKMKPTAFLINTSRGALIDEPALIEALKDGTIAGAGLDVQEVEPLPAESPLYTMDNVIVTPHMGWKGLETRQRLLSILADGIHAYERGEKLNRIL